MAQIQSLRAPPNLDTSNRGVLLDLNTRFASLENLGQLDAAVITSQSASSSLKSQLDLSKSTTDALINSTRETTTNHIQSAQELSILRHSLEDELSTLSKQLLSDPDAQATLLADLEALHRNLKELQSVKEYVHLVEHALRLSEAAIAQTQAETKPISLSSLSQYKALQDFVSKVSSSCESVSDASGQQTLQIVTFLQSVSDKTWVDIQGKLTATLLTAAEALKWPMPVDYISASVEERKLFEAAFNNLLRLQSVGAKLQVQSAKEGLYPLHALVQPVALRFKYHFDGTRQTNRLDKPEWYFTHVSNVMHEHRPFMEDIVQQLIASSEYRDINSWREFAYLLLPLLTKKLKRTVPSLLPHPSLLAHTIYQALAFDSALLEDGFGLSGTSASSDKWEGISDFILGRKDWFDAWMDGERRFAEDQYQDIISAPDAWLIADDDGDEGNRDLKSTNSARRVRALVEQVTDRYSPLPHFTHRTRFLITVQLPLLEYYHSRISSSLDAFETLSSAFVRAVPGALGVSLSVGGGNTTSETGARVDTRRLTSGVDGVQRLCKALVSAKCLEGAMKGWGEELFFLELWTEINHKASLRARAEANPLLPDPKAGSEADTPEDTIFEELVTQYRKIAERAEEMIVHQVCGEIEGGLKAHFANPQSPKLEDDIALSQSLLGPIALLSTHLTFLRTTLPPTIVTNLYRRITTRLSDHILQRGILYRGRGRIMPEEGRATAAECELWMATCQSALPGAPRARIEAPWARLMDAGRLLVLDSVAAMALDEKRLEAVGIEEMNWEEVQQVLRMRQGCQ